MAPITDRMLTQIRDAALAALLVGTMGASPLRAQTAGTPAPQAEEDIRWTLPPPAHRSMAPAQPVAEPSPMAAAPAETPNPFGSAPTSRLLPQPTPTPGPEPTPAPPEAASMLAPTVTLPMAMQPSAAVQQPAPVALTPPATAPVAAAPAPAPAKAPVAKQAAAKKPIEKKQAAAAKPAAKPVAKIADKAAGKPQGAKTAQAHGPKTAQAPAKPVVQTRPPEPVPPPPSMSEKEPEEKRIPVISTMMDGVSSVGKKIGGLFD